MSKKLNETSTDNNETIEIVVLHHKELFDILNSPRRLCRFLVSLSVVIIIILGGLAISAIVIKQYFPYSAIKTTDFGAAIIQNDEKDVIYWLYNTADLWSNSGIQVHEGDEITIRSSGAVHTALHHLVEWSEANSIMDYDWIDTNGSKVANKTRRDSLRSSFRLYPSGDWGMLLMKILTKDEADMVANWKSASRENADSLLTTYPFIEPIGKERRSIIATRDGYLHFALNDIVLTDEVIHKMYADLLDDLAKMGILNNKDKDFIFNAFSELKDEKGILEFERTIKENLSKEKMVALADSANDSTKAIQPGNYPKRKKTPEDGYPFVNDFLFYKIKNFKDAWYVDNIGSFLLVIEIKRKER